MIISIHDIIKHKGAYEGNIIIRKRLFASGPTKTKTPYYEILIDGGFLADHFYGLTHVLVDYDTDTNEFSLYFKKNMGLELKPFHRAGIEYMAVRFKQLDEIKEFQGRDLLIKDYQIGEPDQLTFRI